MPRTGQYCVPLRRPEPALRPVRQREQPRSGPVRGQGQPHRRWQRRRRLRTPRRPSAGVRSAQPPRLDAARSRRRCAPVVLGGREVHRRYAGQPSAAATGTQNPDRRGETTKSPFLLLSLPERSATLSLLSRRCSAAVDTWRVRSPTLIRAVAALAEGPECLRGRHRPVRL